jgi:hypothetical protein
MIYAIRAVGTEFVKFGIADNVGNRLKQLDTGCPHELHIEALANWPNGHESAIHRYLRDHCEKFEWFRDSQRTQDVIAWMRDQAAGLTRFQYEFAKFIGKSDWHITPKRLIKARESRPDPRVDIEPALELRIEPKAHERYDAIRQLALERKARKAAKRSQEPAEQSTG